LRSLYRSLHPRHPIRVCVCFLRQGGHHPTQHSRRESRIRAEDVANGRSKTQMGQSASCLAVFHFQSPRVFRALINDSDSMLGLTTYPWACISCQLSRVQIPSPPSCFLYTDSVYKGKNCIESSHTGLNFAINPNFAKKPKTFSNCKEYGHSFEGSEKRKTRKQTKKRHI
jgi:hypothetical protein